MHLRPAELDFVTTGIAGLDDIIAGGFTPHRLYLVEGVPGSGKTTLALQFLLEGVRLGEPVLYVTLSESAEELHAVARSHGWTLDGIAIRELTPSETNLLPDEQYTMFHPSEIELGETTRTILDDVDRLRPTRVVFDSLSELRLIAGNPLRYRRQILALKQFFVGRKCTVLLLDDMTSSAHDQQVHSISHGVLLLEQLVQDFGVDRRRLRVVKFRGVQFRGGYHDFIIRRGGLEVFPRLVASEHRGNADLGTLASGVPELDELLGGGLGRGTSTLLAGAAGTGKSTVAARFAWTAGELGLNAVMFLFDESRQTLFSRLQSLGMDLQPHVDAGRLVVQQVDPAEMSPGQLAQRIRDEVEQRGVAVVVLDSLNGFLQSMPGERYLILQLHEILAFLGQAGVATILISTHQGVLGGPMQSPVDASYLADAIVLMRYFEMEGEVRQAISVVKKRGGGHERTIREFCLREDGIHVGKPLRNFRGVLTGVPEVAGGVDPPEFLPDPPPSTR